jgi:hypothetical protein
MNLRRELSQEVQKRLAAGEDKTNIYNALKGKYSAAAVGRSLAQWPYPADKEKNRFLNYPLMIIVIVFALASVLRLIAVFQAGPLAAAIPAALAVIIHLYIIYGIKNYNQIGYLLAVLLGISVLLSARSLAGSNMMPLALAAAAIVLAFIQKSRLFPCTSWILTHKKDEAGNPIF